MPCLKISDESFWQREGSPLGWLWLLGQSPVTKDKEEEPESTQPLLKPRAFLVRA